MPGELTPRNNFPYPSKDQDPYFDTYKAGELARDAAHWAHAENDLITINGGGNISWDAPTSTMTWASAIEISTFTTLFKLIIAPDSQFLQDGEILFYQMPRLLGADVAITLLRGSRVNISGVRLHDLRIFATRVGDKLLLPEGRSLLTGEVSVLFGGGVSAGSVSTATSASAGGTLGILTADEDLGLIIDGGGIMSVKIDGATIQLNGSGQLEAVGGGLVSVATSATADTGVLGITRGDEDRGVEMNGTGTLFAKIDGTTLEFDGGGNISVKNGGPVGSHQHMSPVIIEPNSIGVTTLDALITATSSPAVISIQVFRNGQLLAQGGGLDYTFTAATGFITLALPTQTLVERFIVERIGTVV